MKTEVRYNSPSRRLTWSLVLLVLRCILVWGARVRVVGADTVPRQGPLILASNHVSHFDPPLIALALPRPVDWMAMVELYSQGWSKRLFVSLNTIPVRRGSPDRSALRDAVSRLHAGRAVGIFPEGGIRDGSASLLDSGRPQRGAALLARMTEARVLPCVILGSDRLYNRRRWRPGSRANVWISFGTPFEAPSDDEDFSRVLIAHIHALREDLLTHHKATAQDLPLPPRQRMNEP